MPYYHCNKCHHEFEGYPSDGYKMEEDGSILIDNPKCDWCDGDSYILEEETPLETMCKPENMDKLLGELVAYEHQKSCNTRKH